jgi:hypothetical protein
MSKACKTKMSLSGENSAQKTPMDTSRPTRYKNCLSFKNLDSKSTVSFLDLQCSRKVCEKDNSAGNGRIKKAAGAGEK